MRFWHNTPGALGMCVDHSNVIFGHQGVLSASQHNGGTTCTGSIGSRLCGVKIWWRSELWIKSCGTKCVWCLYFLWSSLSACLELGAYSQRIKVLCFEQDPVSFPKFSLLFTNTKKTVQIQCVGIQSSLRQRSIISHCCHHEILLGETQHSCIWDLILYFN